MDRRPKRRWNNLLFQIDHLILFRFYPANVHFEHFPGNNGSYRSLNPERSRHKNSLLLQHDCQTKGKAEFCFSCLYICYLETPLYVSYCSPKRVDPDPVQRPIFLGPFHQPGSFRISCLLKIASAYVLNWSRMACQPCCCISCGKVSSGSKLSIISVRFFFSEK